MEGGEPNASQEEESRQEETGKKENHQEESCQEEKEEKVVRKIWIKKRADVIHISSFLLTTRTTSFDYQ